MFYCFIYCLMQCSLFYYIIIKRFGALCKEMLCPRSHKEILQYVLLSVGGLYLT